MKPIDRFVWTLGIGTCFMREKWVKVPIKRKSEGNKRVLISEQETDVGLSSAVHVQWLKLFQ